MPMMRVWGQAQGALLVLLAAAAVYGQSVPIFSAEEVSIPVTRPGGVVAGAARVTVYADPKVKWEIPKTTIPPWLLVAGTAWEGTRMVELQVLPGQFTQDGRYSASLNVRLAGTTRGDFMTVHADVGTGAGVSPINALPANLVLRGPANLVGIQGTIRLTNTDGRSGTPFQVTTPDTKWLTVTADRNTTPATLTVVAPLVNRMDLHTDHVISVTIPSSGAALHIPVSVSKYAPGPSGFTLGPAPREFRWTPGPFNPDSQSVPMQITRDACAPWWAYATSNGNWLRVGSLRGHGTFAVSSDEGEGPIWVLAEPTGLAPGRYEGTVRVETCNFSGAFRPPQSFNVSLVVEPGPPPRLEAITNAASLAAGIIARGLIVTAWGTGCGGGTGMSGRVSNSALVCQLGSTRLLFGGIPAPLLFAGDRQLNAIVPYDVPEGASIPVQLEVNGVRSAPVYVRMAEAAPGIFSADMSGRGPGAILNQDGTLNSPNHPAVRGSVIMMWATGEGVVSPGAPSGQIIASNNLRKPVLPVSVTLGGAVATVLYAGSAPGFVSGAMQVNVQVPPNAPAGDKIPVVLKVGSASSPDSVTVAIR